MALDNTTELIWKEAMPIMEQDYTTSDSVSSEDLASGRIIPNPNDDGEHPFTDAPPKPARTQAEQIRRQERIDEKRPDKRHKAVGGIR